jgi:hypothetical protein
MDVDYSALRDAAWAAEAAKDRQAQVSSFRLLSHLLLLLLQMMPLNLTCAYMHVPS